MAQSSPESHPQPSGWQSGDAGAQERGFTCVSKERGRERTRRSKERKRGKKEKEIRLADGEKGKSGSPIEQRRPKGLGTVGEGEMGANEGKGRWRWKGQEEPARGGPGKRWRKRRTEGRARSVKARQRFKPLTLDPSPGSLGAMQRPTPSTPRPRLPPNIVSRRCRQRGTFQQEI